LQSKEGLLLLLMPSLHLTALLLEHFSVVLENVGVGGGRHNDTGTRAKNFLFCLCIVDLGTITGSSGKPNKTFKGSVLREEYYHIQVHLSRKLYPHGDVTSKTYKSTFHNSHLSHNTSYGSVATLWVFCLP